ncbi:MAG: SAM-dependent methyltransferase [Muribaculaceae bacterium]|nr:SAM-dependent methyltransferase [Muribaculaceae bacterium]
MQQALYMIPVPISDGEIQNVLPPSNIVIVRQIRHFIVENIRTARRFLKKIDPSIEISELTFYELNGHTPENEINSFIDALRKGHPIGVMSEAGCPGVADPGAKVVSLAQREGFSVIPLVGPSSILLALMASGLNGQKFAFQGYLPVKDNDRDKAIRDLENQSRRQDMTQIFIETPYRNNKMMESLLKNLSADTLLCVAANITSAEGEKIVTKTVKRWRTEGFQLDKVPTIFLFYSLRAPSPVSIRI